ncbi:hypothetical protein OPKNFCMD_3776 [Methylobacterium crusticola]|uniref:Uncharacterized protein n=1 Tax=Methylobacterium crusticola TaxID=1697972 RepID=A0ABQ4R241_9HYPH|nr:hypothetical protein OPKNFCMD_3776 [Methylobacterium crusticola]
MDQTTLHDEDVVSRAGPRPRRDMVRTRPARRPAPPAASAPGPPEAPPLTLEQSPATPCGAGTSPVRRAASLDEAARRRPQFPLPDQDDQT